jgi:hypothetical protein
MPVSIVALGSKISNLIKVLEVIYFLLLSILMRRTKLAAIVQWLCETGLADSKGWGVVDGTHCAEFVYLVEISNGLRNDYWTIVLF